MAETSQSRNKTIAKNTIVLYCRMVVMTLIAFYTSRVILKQLGVTDFGIYNIAGGVVGLMGVLNGSLSSATQRFLSTKIGEGNSSEINITFNRSLTIHIAMAILVMLAGETLGVWLFDSKINIPPNREAAAMWVYQLSLVSSALSIAATPYSAAIVSYERMTFFAYTSVIQAVLKLFVCYMLIESPFDRLVYYAVLLLIVTIVMLLANVVYCMKMFRLGHYAYERFTMEKYLPMLSFSFWTLIGSVFGLCSWQVLNIVFNYYFGVELNAAMGIANQVMCSLAGLILNFQTAYRPALVKLYASHDIGASSLLVSRASRFSYYLVILVTLPLFFSSDYVLQVWLDEVPPYTSIFVKIIIVHFWLDAFSLPYFYFIEATGRIMVYHVAVSVASFIALALCVVVTALTHTPVWAMVIISIVITFFIMVLRIVLFLMLSSWPAKATFVGLLKLCVLTFVITPFYYAFSIAFADFLLLISTILLSFLCLIPIYHWGITKEERQFIKRFVVVKLK